MGIEASQTDEHLNRAPQPEMEPGAQTEVIFPQNFTPLSLNQRLEVLVLVLASYY